MTTSNDLDTVSHSWDEHSEHNGLPSQAQMQVAEASPAQKAAPAATEPVPVDVGNGTPVKPEAPAEAKAPAAAAPHEYVADANHGSHCWGPPGASAYPLASTTCCCSATR